MAKKTKKCDDLICSDCIKLFPENEMSTVEKRGYTTPVCNICVTKYEPEAIKGNAFDWRIKKNKEQETIIQ